MRQLVTLLAALALLGHSHQALAQVDLQASLNYGPSAALTNPALLLDRDVTVQLLNVMSATSFDFAPADIGTVEAGRLNLTRARFAAGYPESGRAEAQLDASTLLVNIRRERSQWGFAHSYQVRGSALASRDLAEIILFGNAELVDRDLELVADGGLSSWHEFGVHYAGRLSPKLVFGGRAKLLLGANDLRIDPASRLDARVAAEGYAATYDADIRVLSANYRIDVDELSFSGPERFLEPGGGTGGAIDLGVVVTPTEAFELSLAIQDLGLIRWEGEELTAKGSGVYRGAEGNVFAPGYSYDLDSAIDQVIDSVDPKNVPASYTAATPLRFCGHARYRLSPKLGLAVSGSAIRLANGVRGGVMATADLALSEGVHLGGGIGIENGQMVAGARGSLRVGVLQFFASADHLPGLFNPYGSRATQVRTGLAFGFGRARVKASGGGWYDEDAVSAGRVTPDNML